MPQGGAMKRIVSISLGSSKRNHKAEVQFKDMVFSVERIGTDGDMNKMVSMISELDGQVSAFGLGGIDLYLGTPVHRYTIRDGKKMVSAAKKTPIVDGSGLKNTLERMTINYLNKTLGWDFAGKTALLTSAMDRWGMAEELEAAGCKLEIGDLIFALGVNFNAQPQSTEPGCPGAGANSNAFAFLGSLSYRQKTRIQRRQVQPLFQGQRYYCRRL
jgi:hypothetical protein